jgi:hypothetical protein
MDHRACIGFFHGAPVSRSLFGRLELGGVPDRSRRAVVLPDLAWLEQATTLTKLRAGHALTGYTHLGQVQSEHMWRNRRNEVGSR